VSAFDQANYCTPQEGEDSCLTGLEEKDGTFKNNAFGVTLAPIIF
jgi:hypothetical protein